MVEGQPRQPIRKAVVCHSQVAAGHTLCELPRRPDLKGYRFSLCRLRDRGHPSSALVPWFPNSKLQQPSERPRTPPLLVPRSVPVDHNSFLLWNRMLLSPLSRGLYRGGLIILPRLGDIGRQRIVWVGGTEESLDGQQDRADLEGGGPVICHLVSISLLDYRFSLSHSVLFRTSKQIRPSLSTLGWKILVRKRILGGVMG